MASKIRITKQDDLPRHNYPISGKVCELISSIDSFTPFASKVRLDIESDLKNYDIADKTTLKNLYTILMMLDVIEGHLESVLSHLEIVKQQEDKEASRLTGSLEIEAHIATLSELKNSELDENYLQTFRRHYSKKIVELPWHLISGEVKSLKGQAETLNKNILLGMIDQYLQPMADSNGAINRSGAAMIVSSFYAIFKQLPVKNIVIDSLQCYINQHQEKKPNIWPARSIDLTHSAFKLNPVNIAIWDSGVDMNVFKDGLKIKENSDREFVEDLHHIAYDMHWNRTKGLLAPMSDATRPIEDIQADFKGFFDLIAALDTPESQAIKQKIADLKQEDVKSFIEDFTRYASYSHGTHVSGIAIEGNPAASLITARLSSNPSMKPYPPSIEEAIRAASAFKDVVNFFKDRNVRVVNMSWVMTKSSFEHALEVNGIGSSAEERKSKARELFEIYKKGLINAISSAPDILFIGGAGNSNNNVAFDEFIPSMFDLKNLLIAGAVDQAGDPTSFTSFGPTVNVYSNGFEVESKVPGGCLMKLSGTSMAAPNITNLAAKLLSINSALTPSELIQLIKEGSEERRKGDLVMRIIHPQQSLKLLQKKSL